MKQNRLEVVFIMLVEPKSLSKIAYDDTNDKYKRGDISQESITLLLQLKHNKVIHIHLKKKKHSLEWFYKQNYKEFKNIANI